MRPKNPIVRRGTAEARLGFTLVELLVVIFIIVLISAATLPAILPALNQRRVSEGSRLLQAELSRQRDLAVRANAPRGLRLLPDPIDPSQPQILTSSRIIALELGPDYDDGAVDRYFEIGPFVNPPSWQYYPPAYNFPGAAPTFPTLPSYFDSGGAQVFNNFDDPNGVVPLRHLYPYLVVRQSKAYLTPSGIALPNSPTSWFFNIRQGEKLRFNDSGQVYTIAGPITDPTNPVQAFNDVANTLNELNFKQPNPDRFINFGPRYISTIQAGAFDFLFLMNNKDDDKDGYVDEGFDGIDNDGDGIIDPGFNGKDDDGNGLIDDAPELYLHATGPNGTGPFVYPGNPFGLPDGGFPAFISPGPPYLRVPNAQYPNEFEEERFINLRTVAKTQYTINRRPVPTEGAREISLPTNVVIDLTTFNASQPERSRLPVDPFTGFVDVMIAPNGQVVVAGPSANNSPPVNFPFYHFWLTEHEAINSPTPLNPAVGKTFLLPMPRDSGYDPFMPTPSVPLAQAQQQNNPPLKSERRLLSINTRSGVITATALETFYLNNPSHPYEAAESGQKDVQP